VGNLDGHDVVDGFGALNLVSGQLTTRIVERDSAQAQGQQATSGQRRWQAALARH
jgi:hypothetical protein